MCQLRKKPTGIWFNQGSLAVEYISKGRGGPSLTGDLQAEARQASVGDALGGFPATGIELD